MTRIAAAVGIRGAQSVVTSLLRVQTGHPSFPTDVLGDSQVALGTRASPGVPARTAKIEHVSVVCDGRLEGEDIAQPSSRTVGVVTPAEIVAHAYLRWRDEWAARLVGDFAVILWDEKEKRLVCARDAVGVRPLYLREVSSGLLVASEPRSLATVPGLSSCEVNAVQAGLFLLGRYSEGAETLYAGVSCVRAGTVVSFSQARTRSRTFWNIGELLHASSESSAPEEELVEALRGTIATSFERGGRVAAEISGGLDSTSVACLATGVARKSETELSLLTLGFGGLACDERRFSRKVAEKCGLPLAELDALGNSQLLSPLPGCQPADTYWHPMIAVKRVEFEFLQAESRFILLTGTGADQLMRRNPSAEIASAFQEGRWSRAHREWLGATPTTRSAAIRLIVAHWLRRMTRWAGRRRLGGPTLAQVPDWIPAQRHGPLRDALSEQRADLADRAQTPLDMDLLIGLHHELPLALATLDRMAMPFGIELRHPFLDRRVIETLLRIPHSVRSGRGDSLRKPLLRSAMRDRLPAVVVDRATSTVFDPYARWVLDCCRSDVVSVLRDRPRVVECGLALPHRIGELLEHPAADLNGLIRLVGLEVWLRELEATAENKMDSKTTSTTLPVRDREVPRQPYTKPTLTEYGDVREITKGSGGSHLDANRTPHA